MAETAKQRSKGSLNSPRKQNPPLVPLRYGARYCQLCREPVRAGDRVAWWQVRARDRRAYSTIYCQSCHHANVRAGRALQ